MPGLAREGDSMLGHFDSEHGGHYYPDGSPTHPSGDINGTISPIGCSENVFINGKKAAIVGSQINEVDICTPGNGTCSNGSSNVFINGKPAVRLGDKTITHVNNTGKITSASGNVFN